MPPPLLTIGMATFEDYDGVAFTLQSLRLSNDLTNVELIVIDNSPDTPQGRDTEQISRNCGATYIPMPENTGTTQPRNRIFQEAHGDAVMCLDSHVLLRPNTVNKLIEWYRDNPDSCDLYSGPLLHDDLDNLATHFDPVWRDGMWGKWGDDPRAKDENSPPFEVWGQGLGLFTCRRNAWLGFNKHFRAFGGEEGYIHEKYRQAGHKAICLPWLRWWHRFGRPGGVKYPISDWNKVRNYVIGHLELGLPLDPIHEHFVAGNLVSALDWQLLISDPIAQTEPGVALTQGAPPAEAAIAPETIEGIYDSIKNNSTHMSEHMDTLRELTSQCQVVEDISRYRETTVALFAGKPKVLRSHLYGPGRHDPLFAELDTLTPMSGIMEFSRDTAENCGWAVWKIKECDMLVYKTPDQYQNLPEDLKKWTPLVKRWFVIMDTAYNTYLPNAVFDFLEESPDWFLYSYTINQFGLTVLGRRSEDRPE